jgi:hypothetical protein
MGFCGSETSDIRRPPTAKDPRINKFTDFALRRRRLACTRNFYQAMPVQLLGDTCRFDRPRPIFQDIR